MIYDNVFADATHLNFASRNKTISRINVPVDEINVVFLDTPLDICIERNAKREGRKFVPETVIKNMHKSIKLPEKEEGINKVYIVKDNNQKLQFYINLAEENRVEVYRLKGIIHRLLNNSCLDNTCIKRQFYTEDQIKDILGEAIPHTKNNKNETKA